MTGWHLKGKPLAVQSEAIRRGKDKDRFGEWLEMGLAKTATDLHEHIEALCQDEVNGHLIFAPNHLKGNWVEQMNIWLPSPAKVVVWPDEHQGFKTDKFVINYEALLTKSGMSAVRDFMKGRKIHLTTDEAQRYKNFKSQTYKALVPLAREAVMVRALTGTPMTQSVMDYWPQLQVLNLFRGTNPYAFRNRYAKMGGYMGKQVVGFQNQEELNKLIDPHVFRALFADWNKDVPEGSHGVISFDMTPKQEKIYKEMADDFLTMIGNTEVSAEMVITQMRKLQQIARGFIMNEGKVIRLFEKPGDNPSFKALLAALEDTRGKTIIFTIHDAATDELFEGLNKLGLGTAVLRGGMKPGQIDREKRDFNEIAKCRNLVAQTSIGKEGHTLLGDQTSPDDACYTTMYYEDTYNLGDRMQSESRNRRQGQKYPVRCLDFVCSPIDRHTAAARQTKKLTVKALVDVLRGIPR